MSLISGLSALTYPLTSSLGAANSAKTKAAVGDVFQNVLAKQTGTQASSLTQPVSTQSVSTQSTSAGKQSTADEFQQYMAMSPAEKLRYSVMSDLNITQDQLDAMPADQRALAEKKIEDLMKLREELQTAHNAADGQQSQAATGLSLLKQVQAGQKPQPSVDIFS
jgi:hypothetical protein